MVRGAWLQAGLLPAARSQRGAGHERIEQFLKDHPDAAGKPYRDALAASLSLAFPCPTQ